MIPISLIIATTLLGLISMVHHCIRSQGDMRNPFTDSSAMTVVTEVPGPAPKVVPLRGEETTRMLSIKQSAEASPDLNNFHLSQRINVVRPNQSADVLFSMSSVFGPPNTPDPERPGLKQQQLQAFVNDVCTCNHEAVNLHVTYSQRGVSRIVPVRAGVCSCQHDFFQSNGQNGEPILCQYRVQNALIPGSNRPTFGAIRDCLGRQFLYLRYATTVGLYEYRAVQARAPVTFQYAGPARHVLGRNEPIVSIFTIVICNEFSLTPVNLVVTPLFPNPVHSWTVLGQKPVYREGGVCTSVDHRRLAQLARRGQNLYCNYVVNGVSASCGTPDSRLQPWTYDTTSNVAAFVTCSGAEVPVCSIARMYDWLRWSVHQ